MRKPVSMTLLLAAVLALATIVSLENTTSAQPKNPHEKGGLPYSSIYVFGDSLSDTGNLFSLTGLPPKPYFKGRFSNGIVWVEYLAQTLGLEQDSIVNFAFGGATTGRRNFNDIPVVLKFPGLETQLEKFEKRLSGKPADPDALYVIWAGANDFFLNDPSLQTITTGVSNTSKAIQRLDKAGAKHIVVLNLPDLGLTPYGRSENPVGLSLASTAYNLWLDIKLHELRFSGIEIARIDVAGLLREIVESPDEFGLSNATDSYLATDGDVDQFLYWDTVHPTTRGHQILAKAAEKKLRQRTRRGR